MLQDCLNKTTTYVNTAEVKTLKPTLEKVLKRFPIKRIIVVADRGLLSTDNLEELQKMRLPCGAPLEFILAVPGRRYRDFADLLLPFHEAYCHGIETEVVGETLWQGLRLVMRQRLKDANTGLSPSGALSQLQRIQHHPIEFNEKPLTGISTLTQDHQLILESLETFAPYGRQAKWLK